MMLLLIELTRSLPKRLFSKQCLAKNSDMIGLVPTCPCYLHTTSHDPNEQNGSEQDRYYAESQTQPMYCGTYSCILKIPKQQLTARYGR